MNKIDGLTAAALAFAGFAAWYVTKKPSAAAGNANVQGIFDVSKSQRYEVGDSIGANFQTLGATFGLTSEQANGTAVVYGLAGPTAGWW